MRQFPQVTWLVALAASFIPGTMRWGPDGHRIVAQVALDHLSPAVANETRRLLGGQNITDIASWADDARRSMPETGPWHYIDIEVFDTSYVPARDCKDDACVIAAVAKESAILADRSKSDSLRAIALKFVVHFIGDLHQPLHAGERGDKGGNDVKLTFNGKLTNLHSIWDSGLLLSYGQSDDEIVKQIDNELSKRNDVSAIGAGSVTSWVMQSHDISRDVVYKNLPGNLEITAAYAEAARPVIHEQLLRGGVRLAATLERLLGH